METNEKIFDEIARAMRFGSLEEIEELVERYAGEVVEEDLEYPSYEEEVLAVAVREGNYDYVCEHAADFDLNIKENSWGEPYSPYIDETENENIRQALYDRGAFVDWEEFRNAPIAIDAANGVVISFTAEFQEEVYEQVLDYLGYDPDELIESLEDPSLSFTTQVADYSLDKVEELLDWVVDDEEIRFTDFGYGVSENGDQIMEILEALGFEFDYVGSNIRDQANGVYYLKDE